MLQDSAFKTRIPFSQVLFAIAFKIASLFDTLKFH